MKIEFELKPCPFCGERAHIVYVEHYGCPCVAIKCLHCLAQTDVAPLPDDIDIERPINLAAEYWNQRA